MDFEDVQEILIDRLKNESYKGMKIPSVFEVSVPAGLILPKANGAELPYALISFGGQSPVAQRNKGIVSTTEDVKWTAVAVEAIATNPADVRQVTKIVRGLFEGFSPHPSWGELEEQLAGDYTVLQPDADLAPVRFATGIVFNTLSNAQRPAQ